MEKLSERIANMDEEFYGEYGHIADAVAVLERQVDALMEVARAAHVWRNHRMDDPYRYVDAVESALVALPPELKEALK